MTVKELCDFLEMSFEDDEKIYLSHDRGYTYGAISEQDFEGVDETEEEE